MGEVLARFDAVTMQFGDLVAVDKASLEIRSGEVLAVLGENGAGKSTLMKLLYGVFPPTDGTIVVEGCPDGISGPAEALRQGIGMVFQHFSQLPALSVRDNLLLAWPKTPFWKSRRNRATGDVLSKLRDMAPAIDPDTPVHDLSVGEQQIVELVKVLNIQARIVILDEPTSVLTPAETDRLHGFICQLAADGVAVVLITHKLRDVEACADRIAVMRRGAIVDVSYRGERSMQEIVTLMMGKTVDRKLPSPQPATNPVDRLVLQYVSAQAAGMRLRDISLAVGRGEVVGVAGVAGNGQTLLAEVVAGIQPVTYGEVLLDGERIGRRRPGETLSTPLGYIPEQPRENATVEQLSLADNLALRDLAEGNRTDGSTSDLLCRFNVNPPVPDKRAGTLSGGNLQKLVSARELGTPRPAILACYPTMGLDLAAIELVYEHMFAQAAAGAAVLWISEDLDDLLAAAHRIAVIREGAIVALETNDGTLTRDRIGALMAGMASVSEAA
ncbi:ATP-binding cassette domain-containing protein [Oricola sp.]|uniref:ABC transporter ATP-binding protein n=1 Tax=Oricola sp. TaxID=1979950 RepID=UPI0025DC558B|nr:ATP-binding cassette domain-containing protein [Oricola sp.]MCI5075060.1 ATP-binding cassette domain-containing protein [Oricola sp.]